MQVEGTDLYVVEGNNQPQLVPTVVPKKISWLILVLTDQELSDAGQYVEWLRLSLHERHVPVSNRVRAAGPCFAITQDHHHAIVVLLGKRLFASGFALLRSVFEAYVRGEWLVHCAEDADIEKFLAGQEPPKIHSLLNALEQTDAFKSGTLSLIKKDTWKALCAYTHTGGLHVQRWNTTDGIEPNYTREEVLEVLRFAEIIATVSVLGVATLLNDSHLAERVSERFNSRHSL